MLNGYCIANATKLTELPQKLFTHFWPCWRYLYLLHSVLLNSRRRVLLPDRSVWYLTPKSKFFVNPSSIQSFQVNNFIDNTYFWVRTEWCCKASNSMENDHNRPFPNPLHGQTVRDSIHIRFGFLDWLYLNGPCWSDWDHSQRPEIIVVSLMVFP